MGHGDESHIKIGYISSPGSSSLSRKIQYVGFVGAYYKAIITLSGKRTPGLSTKRGCCEFIKGCGCSENEMLGQISVPARTGQDTRSQDSKLHQIKDFFLLLAGLFLKMFETEGGC